MKKTFRDILLLLLFTTGLYAQSDCPDAIVVCGNHDYYGLNATGIGVQELGPNACFSQENNSLWLKIMIKDGGTLGFVITPEEIDDLVVDFDFWIFGTNVTCSDLGTAIRCSTTNPLAAGLDYNTTGMNETETDVSEGLGADGNSFIQWMEVNDGDVYYLIIDRPHGASNFSLEWTGTATFHEIPVFNNPDEISIDIVQCDNDGTADNKTFFDLTTHAEMFIGEQTGVELTYHLSENDMVTGENPVTSPEAFENSSSPQTIYMKMTDVVTGCYSNEIFTIKVNPGAGVPQDITLCDDDGIAEFDLGINDSAIANGSTNAVITYYTSQENAVSGIGAIGPLYENEQPYISEQIWARLEKDETCVDFASFTINILPVPEFNTPGNMPPNITLCDNDGTDDGAVIFDLTVNEDAMRGSQDNIIFTYFEDMAGLPALNPITSPQVYQNVPNPQLIHVKMENSSTGCYTIGIFTLYVTPGAGTAEDLILCDGDDGIALFDLSVNDNAVANGNSNATVTYYRTQEDAENNEYSLPIEYENETPYTEQVIWARLDKPDESCTDYTSFSISVLSPPEFIAVDNTPPDITTCDNDGTDDGLTLFNLTVNETMLQGSQQNVEFTYYEDVGGVASTTPITAPESYTSTSNPQIIHITITNTVTGCYSSSSFYIATVPGAGIPEDLYNCSTTGIAQFDLSANDAVLSNGNSNAVISYYTSEADALNGTNPVGPLYENTIPFESEQIWGRTEVLNGYCYDVAPFMLHVVPEPVVNNPQNIDINLMQCDDDSVDDMSTAFNLTEYEAMFLGTQTDVAITYHLTPEDMASGENAISTPQAYANTANPQTIYVRATHTIAECYSGESFIIGIDYTLPTGVPEDLALCDLDENGFQLFDLAQNTPLINNGEANTAVTYYATAQDAENGSNQINRFYTNQQPYITQTIWARLENTAGCFGYGITSFTISILPLPEIDYTLNVTDFTASDNTITINVINNHENYEFSLDGISFTDDNSFEGLKPGLYTILVRSKDNCKTIEIEVPILNYPKFFTPNGDGSNEVWNVNYLHFFPDARVTIFDRYGKVIKSYLGKQQGWDGTYNGHNLPSTDYWFTLEFSAGRIINGHFSMVR